jgi:2-dehydro-3-deoxygluconokinase
MEAVKAAAQKGITVSVDLNYRAKLWQYGKQPHEVMPQLVDYCDVVMGNLWAEEVMLATTLPANLVREKEALLAQSQKTSEEIMQRFPKAKQVANTFRFDAGEGVRYYATLYTGGSLYIANEQQTDYIVDKVGSGDTFMAGLIYGNYHQLPSQEIIDFAAAAAFNKLFIKGDATTSTVEEIKKGFLNYA